MKTSASGAPAPNAIEKVVAACSAITDDWRPQRIIPLATLASFCTDTNRVRLPLYPILDAGTQTGPSVTL